MTNMRLDAGVFAEKRCVVGQQCSTWILSCLAVSLLEATWDLFWLLLLTAGVWLHVLLLLLLCVLHLLWAKSLHAFCSPMLLLLQIWLLAVHPLLLTMTAILMVTIAILQTQVHVTTVWIHCILQIW